MGTKKSSPWCAISRHVALNLYKAAWTHGRLGISAPSHIAAPRWTNIFRHRGAVAFWVFNFKLGSRLAARR